MKKLLVHSTEQPDSDITSFILSCNRLELLEKTITSFLKTRDLITKIVILDDSGVDGVFEKLVEKYGNIADVVCFPENRGLWWAKDFMVSFCFTKYIFYVEDDWAFLKTGYLQKSKNILEKYRDIGSIDISWRTFEEEGFDTYENELIDESFYYKKPWRVSPNHLFWFIWQGSPNLKRRDDLLLLGRVEKYFTEWNIDRKFYSLGFKGVFLNDRYVVHTGDKYSVMVNKRPNESATPETLFPQELIKNRTFPYFDYYSLDSFFNNTNNNKKSFSKVLVTAMVNINRDKIDGRDFFNHYVKSLEKIAKTPLPLIIFCEEQYFEFIYTLRGQLPTLLLPFDMHHIKGYKYYNKIEEISKTPNWQNQAEWIKKSILINPDYISLTHIKLDFLKICTDRNFFNADSYYWIDAGICNSFLIHENFDKFDLHKMADSDSKIHISSYPYYVETEIHGFSKKGYEEICKKIPNTVIRASFFGGRKETINNFYNIYDAVFKNALCQGYLGTEESIFTVIHLLAPELFNIYNMSSGDIKEYLYNISN